MHPGGQVGFRALGHALVVYSRDYYSTTNTFNGDYMAALAPYAIPLNNVNVAPPAQIQQTACDARQHRISTAFILLDSRDNRLHVYCQLTCFTTCHCLPASDWDNRIFIHKGELHNNQDVLVEWLGDYFHQTNQIQVPTEAAITAAYTDPAANDLETLCTRGC